jgi:hypothetical protein
MGILPAEHTDNDAQMDNMAARGMRGLVSSSSFPPAFSRSFAIFWDELIDNEVLFDRHLVSVRDSESVRLPACCETSWIQSDQSLAEQSGKFEAS